MSSRPEVNHWIVDIDQPGWLVSDAGAFITDTSWPLDAGFTLKS